MNNRTYCVRHSSPLHFKVRSHRGKTNAKAKKIEEQSEEIKEKNSNIKENSLSFGVNRP